MLAVHLRDLADALGQSPLTGGKLAAELGDVCRRVTGGRDGLAEALPERLDLGLELGGAGNRGVPLLREGADCLVQARHLRGERLVAGRPPGLEAKRARTRARGRGPRPRRAARRAPASSPLVSSWGCERSSSSSAASAAARVPAASACSRSWARSVSSACARASASSRRWASSCSSPLTSCWGCERSSFSSASSACLLSAASASRAFELGDPLGGVLLRPLELVALDDGRLQLALERADALLDLGRDTGLVGLRGLAQAGLQLVEALCERVPLGEDRVQLRLELGDPLGALGRGREHGLGLRLGRRRRGCGLDGDRPRAPGWGSTASGSTGIGAGADASVGAGIGV